MKTILVAGAVVVGLALAGCAAKPAGPEPGPAAAPGQAVRGDPASSPAGGGAARRAANIPVQAAQVGFGPLTAVHESAGSVVPVTQSQVAVQVGGVVSRLLHQAGEWVAEGEAVVQLDDAQLRLAVGNAQAALETARINLAVAQDTASQSNPKLALQVQSAESTLSASQRSYDSQVALAKLGGASSSQVDSARGQLEQAKANLEAAKFALEQNGKADTQNIAQLRLAVDVTANQLRQAQVNLENASIKAPFAGQIAAVNVAPGMFVGQHTSAFLLVSQERQIAFGVPPIDAPSLPKGTVVRFTREGRGYDVRVRLAPSAPINGIVPMVAQAPQALTLTYGTVGTVSYSLELARGSLVPVAALQTNENQNFVYQIVQGAAAIRPITILAETGSSAAVTGIEAGSQVIINPPPGLLAGSAVRVAGGQAAAPGAPQAPAAGAGGADRPGSGSQQPGTQPGGTPREGAGGAGRPRSGGGQQQAGAAQTQGASR